MKALEDAQTLLKELACATQCSTQVVHMKFLFVATLARLFPRYPVDLEHPEVLPLSRTSFYDGM